MIWVGFIVQKYKFFLLLINFFCKLYKIKKQKIMHFKIVKGTSNKGKSFLYINYQNHKIPFLDVTILSPKSKSEISDIINKRSYDLNYIKNNIVGKKFGFDLGWFSVTHCGNEYFQIESCILETLSSQRYRLNDGIFNVLDQHFKMFQLFQEIDKEKIQINKKSSWYRQKENIDVAHEDLIESFMDHQVDVEKVGYNKMLLKWNNIPFIVEFKDKEIEFHLENFKIVDETKYGFFQTVLPGLIKSEKNISEYFKNYIYLLDNLEILDKEYQILLPVTDIEIENSIRKMINPDSEYSSKWMHPILENHHIKLYFYKINRITYQIVLFFHDKKIHVINYKKANDGEVMNQIVTDYQKILYLVRNIIPIEIF